AKSSGEWISSPKFSTDRPSKTTLFPCASIGYERRVTLGLGERLRSTPTSWKPVAGSLQGLRTARTEAHWNDRHHNDCQSEGRSRKNNNGDQSFGSHRKPRQAHTSH